MSAAGRHLGRMLCRNTCSPSAGQCFVLDGRRRPATFGTTESDDTRKGLAAAVVRIRADRRAAFTQPGSRPHPAAPDAVARYEALKSDSLPRPLSLRFLLLHPSATIDCASLATASPHARLTDLLSTTYSSPPIHICTAQHHAPAMSAIYKEREREREWDSSSRGGGQGYTTVRRYKMPEHSLEQDQYESEMRLVHRGGRSDVDDRRSNFDTARSTKDYVIERDVERDVREYHYHDRSPSPRGRDVREYRIQRTVDRSPSPAHSTVREIRIARDYEREAPAREDQYSLEKYSRDIEYFREPPQQQPQQQPQPIYIRNEAPQPMQMAPIIIREEAPQPIIIRERVEPAYELVERSEIQQERQVARPRHEEDYYYERRVKEVDRGGRHEQRRFDEREYGRDRYDDRNYYSDDDVVYVHKEKDTWEGGETRTKRDVAAGALAGIAAGQIVRHHRKRKGEAPGGTVGNALGYGALGAASAVALDKFNNRDRSRSVSSDRGRNRRHSNGRGRSKSRVRELGTLAAIAGVGALAYAAGRKNKDKGQTTVVEEHRHRSRSRKSRSKRGTSRRGRSRSVTVIESDGGRSRSASKHTDPKHRNNRTAQVGLASAAVAGLMQHNRSKSRKRKGGRSRSRVREGVPIAAAGVAGAAVTGLYERHKAKKETRALSRSRSRSKSRSRSRSVLSRLTGRSRSRRGSTASEPVLVEYGGDPIYTDPATRSRSRGRRRRGSSSSSDGRRHGSRSRSRSKSRARSVAETAAVAGVAGLAAHEAAKRRDRKKAEKEREKRRDEDSAYSTGSYSPYDSPRPSTAHPNDSRFFPETNYFPPPPTAPVDHGAPYPPYNPADYPPPPSTVFEPNHPAGYVNPPPEDMNHGNPYAHPQQQHDAYYGQPRRPDDNVSAPAPNNEHIFAAARDRVITPDPEPPSPKEKTVQFDLKPRGPSREASPDKAARLDDADVDEERQRRRSRKYDERSDGTRESGRQRKRHHRRDESPASDFSDATIELPPRFDEHGRQRAEDPVADKLESVLLSLFR
ncbi:hypothetical protein CC86DRAFT_457991 [Ophiobolus disseminans]|uniref:DUF3824 domain-containing protein n=1 Tax=Ophiobolus disseminans TaxID=1469910 RepID=A0A6A6ZQB2_9PLEO|nr:hypothetical protein CC86DRAFT_457991 [Ophiobolus disseminans]